MHWFERLVVNPDNLFCCIIGWLLGAGESLWDDSLFMMRIFGVA